jgi:hypothetical protein
LVVVLKKILLLVGLVATFAGLSLHFFNRRPHGVTTPAVAADGHVHSTGDAMAGMNHGATNGDGGVGMVNGLELKVLSSPSAAGEMPISFQIVNGSAPQTAFAEAHTKLLHLVVVRSDLSGFQHVHPTMAADGTWSTILKVTPGTWRLVADSAPLLMGGMAMPTVLAAEFNVPGDAPGLAAAPALTKVATVDGYTVTATGEIGIGHPHTFKLTLTKDGAPVTDIGEYLGAYAHLVAFDTKTMTYTHLHPGRELTPGVNIGPDIVFQSQLPKDGIYKLFFEFNAGGSVHRAELVLNVYE